LNLILNVEIKCEFFFWLVVIIVLKSNVWVA